MESHKDAKVLHLVSLRSFLVFINLGNAAAPNKALSSSQNLIVCIRIASDISRKKTKNTC